ncbi:MAG TPA: trypsin-like serine protease [Clostridiales bacterium]|nr:trypsin-like serine protease [Clostridiales bacterium]
MANTYWGNGYGESSFTGSDERNATEPIVLGSPYQQNSTGNYGYSSGGNHKKEPKYATRKFVAGMVCLCILFSAIFGIGGVFVGRELFAAKNQNIVGDTVNTVRPGERQQVTINYNADSPANAVMTGITDISQITAQIADTVVEIVTEQMTTSAFFGQYITKGAGSGVFIDPTGYVITCAHVIDGATTITVKTSNGESYDAKIIGSDTQTDIAVIKIEPKNGETFHAATIGDSDKLVVGQPVIAIGNPLGELGGTVTNGIISATGREIEIDGQKYFLLQTNAAINPGNSGGGLFDISGNLIGIVNAKSSGAGIEGLGFAIPSNTAIKIAKELIEKGYISGRPKLGFVLFEVNDTQDYIQYWRYSQYITDYGVYIAESESPDFKVGDRIIAIDNVTISSIADIKSLLSDYKVGDTVTITISRVDGSGRRPQKLEIPLTLTEQLPSS